MLNSSHRAGELTEGNQLSYSDLLMFLQTVSDYLLWYYYYLHSVSKFSVYLVFLTPLVIKSSK